MRNWIFVGALGVAAAMSSCSPATQDLPPSQEPAGPAPKVASAGSEPVASPPAAPKAQPVTLNIRVTSGAQMSGDVLRGQTVFKRCSQCHSLVEGKNGTGPSLHGVMDRPAGSTPNFRYSEANSSSGIIWTDQEMFDYLENPKGKIPKTIMAYAGLPKEQDRADVIAFLRVSATP